MEYTCYTRIFHYTYGMTLGYPKSVMVLGLKDQRSGLGSSARVRTLGVHLLVFIIIFIIIFTINAAT